MKASKFSDAQKAFFLKQVEVSGLMDAGLKTVPLPSVSLAPHHFQPKREHEAYFHAHLATKGREAADAAVEILKAYAKVPVAARMAAA